MQEAALQNAIHSIEGPLALVRASLLVTQDQQQYQQQQQLLKQESGEQAPPGPAAEAPAAAAATAATAAGGLAPDQISWGSNTHSWGQASPCTSGDAAGGVAGAAAEASGGSVTSSGGASGLAARPYKGGPELLQRINQKEDRVQRVLQQLGCCDSEGYEQLYTTQLLQKAVSDPQRMAGYLNMPKPERLQYWSEVGGWGGVGGVSGGLLWGVRGCGCAGLLVWGWGCASTTAEARAPAVLVRAGWAVGCGGLGWGLRICGCKASADPAQCQQQPHSVVVQLACDVAACTVL